MAGGSDNNQVSAAGNAGVLVSALEHPMVLAALSRMGSTGAWQRVLDGQPLSEDIDVVDAQLLVAAGAITRVSEDTFQSAVEDPMYSNPQALANWAQYLLRRALQHATDQNMVWASEDPETILSFGRASGRGADVIADLLLPQLPALAATFAAGRASSLDVGVGAGAISIRLVERFPGDPCRWARRIAARSQPREGRRWRTVVVPDSIELRLQSVADLRDSGPN